MIEARMGREHVVRKSKFTEEQIAFALKQAERRDRADFAAFDRIMARDGGVPPQPDDRIP